MSLSALAAYPPMGRCKKTSENDTKQRGRNELIADFISVETGQLRTRKQVSSHIQVLKPYLNGNAYGERLEKTAVLIDILT
jgi:hypothetical protein